MAAPVRIEGADRLLELGQAMRAAGQGEMLKELQKALRLAAKPLTPASRAEALRRLPRGGGLADRVARTPQPITARAGGSTASVRFRIGRRGSGAAGAEAGSIRHPVFGRRQFVPQSVPPGWFSDTVDANKTKVRDDISDVLDDFTNRLARRI